MIPLVCNACNGNLIRYPRHSDVSCETLAQIEFLDINHQVPPIASRIAVMNSSVRDPASFA